MKNPFQCGNYILQVMTELFNHPSQTVKNIVESNNWYQIKDIDQLKNLCEEAISQNPSAVSISLLHHSLLSLFENTSIIPIKNDGIIYGSEQAHKPLGNHVFFILYLAVV